MRMLDLIQKKRHGEAHNKEEIEFLINSIVNPELYKDYQLAAWLMAVCLKGMTIDETAYLTNAMANSGEMLDLSSIGPVVGDKHSTGGVGDKTTLVFVPLLASAGIPMAKLSGRGLGHTGGTLDKLESIPGFNVNLSVDKFIKQVKEIGAAVGGQTQDLAPADGIMYALRDVTATVESIPLIAASVMCKKIASGANLIILDVKCGSGAFMATESSAIELAKTMVDVGNRLKRPVTAVVTDMEQPLGLAVGHTLEVIEAIETLKGHGPDDLKELCLSLASMALVKAGKAKNEDKAHNLLENLISSGAALAKFKELIEKQGGDTSVVENYNLMPQAKYTKKIKLDRNTGNKKLWLQNLDGRKIAEACKLMGAGRNKKGDSINLAVGIVLSAKIGSPINLGDTIATIYADSQNQLLEAEEVLLSSFKFSSEAIEKPKVIKARIS